MVRLPLFTGHWPVHMCEGGSYLLGQLSSSPTPGQLRPGGPLSTSRPLTAGLWQGLEGPPPQTGCHPNTGDLGGGLGITGWGGLGAYEGFMHNLKGPMRPWMLETLTPSQAFSGC